MLCIIRVFQVLVVFYLRKVIKTIWNVISFIINLTPLPWFWWVIARTYQTKKEEDKKRRKITRAEKMRKKIMQQKRLRTPSIRYITRVQRQPVCEIREETESITEIKDEMKILYDKVADSMQELSRRMQDSMGKVGSFFQETIQLIPGQLSEANSEIKEIAKAIAETVETAMAKDLEESQSKSPEPKSNGHDTIAQEEEVIFAIDKKQWQLPRDQQKKLDKRSQREKKAQQSSG